MFNKLKKSPPASPTEDMEQFYLNQFLNSGRNGQTATHPMANRQQAMPVMNQPYFNQPGQMPLMNQPQQLFPINQPHFNQPQQPFPINQLHFNQPQQPFPVNPPHFNQQQQVPLINPPHFNQPQQMFPINQHQFNSDQTVPNPYPPPLAQETTPSQTQIKSNPPKQQASMPHISYRDSHSPSSSTVKYPASNQAVSGSTKDMKDLQARIKKLEQYLGFDESN